MLVWQSVPALLKNMQVWAAYDGDSTYVITRDFGCRVGDPFYGRFAATNKPHAEPIGLFDTLEEAKRAIEDDCKDNDKDGL